MSSRLIVAIVVEEGSHHSISYRYLDASYQDFPSCRLMVQIKNVHNLILTIVKGAIFERPMTEKLFTGLLLDKKEAKNNLAKLPAYSSLLSWNSRFCVSRWWQT